MPKFLITRCTTYDMAGVAMINGAINGLTEIYPDAEFAAIMVNGKDIVKHPRMFEQFAHSDNIDVVVNWADCLIDLGGLCKGSDPYRFEYINECRKQDKPYVYMAVSFEHPDPLIVKDVPATARGIHSAEEYKMSAGGKLPPVVPDISFLIEPKPSFLGNDCVCYTTHKGKPWHPYLAECFDCTDKSKLLQVIFKRDDDVTVWEPPLGITGVHASPEQLYGTIANAFHVKTCRYHAAVAAIMAGVPYEIPIGMPNASKYEDLIPWKSMNIGAIRSHAMYSCEFVKEILHGR